MFAAVTAQGAQLFVQASLAVFVGALILYMLHLAKGILRRTVPDERRPSCPDGT
jgi:hypothetical protein